MQSARSGGLKKVVRLSDEGGAERPEEDSLALRRVSAVATGSRLQGQRQSNGEGPPLLAMKRRAAAGPITDLKKSASVDYRSPSRGGGGNVISAEASTGSAGGGLRDDRDDDGTAAHSSQEDFAGSSHRGSGSVECGNGSGLKASGGGGGGGMTAGPIGGRLRECTSGRWARAFLSQEIVESVRFSGLFMTLAFLFIMLVFGFDGSNSFIPTRSVVIMICIECVVLALISLDAALHLSARCGGSCKGGGNGDTMNMYAVFDAVVVAGCSVLWMLNIVYITSNDNPSSMRLVGDSVGPPQMGLRLLLLCRSCLEVQQVLRTPRGSLLDRHPQLVSGCRRRRSDSSPGGGDHSECEFVRGREIVPGRVVEAVLREMISDSLREEDRELLNWVLMRIAYYPNELWNSKDYEASSGRDGGGAAGGGGGGEGERGGGGGMGAVISRKRCWKRSGSRNNNSPFARRLSPSGLRRSSAPTDSEDLTPSSGDEADEEWRYLGRPSVLLPNAHESPCCHLSTVGGDGRGSGPVSPRVAAVQQSTTTTAGGVRVARGLLGIPGDPLLERLDDWDFPLFQIENNTQGQSLRAVAFEAIRRFAPLKPPFNLERLGRFLLQIQAGYSETLPYHNRVHAADVTQTCYWFLKPGGAQEAFQLEDIDCASLMLACAIHDYKHKGLSNAYLSNTNDERAIRYNDKAVQENYSVAEACSLLQDSGYSVSDDKDPEGKNQAVRVRKTLITAVLATDMSTHEVLLNRFNIYMKLPRSNEANLQSQQLRIEILIHTADISNPAKPLDTYLRWTHYVLEEFFLEGD
eukprot:GHVU01053463.1.p1 GENE.GHVU01053463.1~~GHVU01053463.1.p1  ORF type:complete len:804 (+),score=104.29 GHVU01053463.1:1466-3877(+)